MKRLLTTLGLGIACLAARAQTDPAYPAPPTPSTIASAEVFVDIDPGIGAATPVTTTTGMDLTATAAVPSASLTPGMHRIFLRSRSATGAWSLTMMSEFLVDFNPAYPAPAPAPASVVRAEYFVDTDPGRGLGTPVALTPATTISSLTFSVNTAALPTGLHRLFVRTQNATGQWSVPEPREFAVTQDYAYPPAASQALSPVTKAEYFIDTDPGHGAGTPVSLSSGTDVSNAVASINVQGLAVGTHRVGLRTQDTAGRWSASALHEILVTDDYAYPTATTAPGPVIAAEYFVDTDPGFGQATPITLTPGSDLASTSIVVNTTGLAAGLHTLHIRSRQNPWSVTTVQAFSVSTPLSMSLTRFSAAEKDGEAVLTWEVSREESLKYFDVERSAEGQSWTSVGRVDAAGRHAYTFADVSPLTDDSYYRLKIVERNGDASYSGVQKLYFGKKEGTLTLRPNPVQSRLFVDGLEAGAQLEVWSMMGGLTTGFISKENNEGYDVSALPAGTYLLRIKAVGTTTKTFHFVKH